MMVGEENGNALNCVVTCGKLNEAVKKQPYLHGKAVFLLSLIKWRYYCGLFVADRICVSSATPSEAPLRIKCIDRL